MGHSKEIINIKFNKAKEEYEKAVSEYRSASTERSYNSCWRSSPELSFGCLEKYKEKLESKKNKYDELRKERNNEIEKELKDVEKAIGIGVSAKIFLDNYIKKEEETKAKAEELRKEAKAAADKAEADRLAKEIADKVEAERLKLEQEVAAKAKAEADRIAKEASDKAEAEKLEREAKIKAEELAEKLIAEAKDIIANAGHEREIVNPKLVQLLKDKKLEDLEQYLKSAREKDMNIVTTLEKFKKFNGEYNLNEGSKILSQFNAVKEEMITESKEQLSFIAEIQRYTKNIKLGTEMIDVPNYEKEGILQEINTKTTEYHDHGEEL